MRQQANSGNGQTNHNQAGGAVKSVVVGAHSLVRVGTTHVSQSLPANIEAIGVEPDEALFENFATHADAELALIGLPLPGTDDLPTLSRPLQQPHPRHVAMLGGTDSAAHVCTLMQLNVSAYLLKNYSDKLIVAALELVLAGGRHVPAPIVLTRSEVNATGSSSGNGNDDYTLLDLTQRQYETLVLLSCGYPVKAISRMLSIFEATTKTHINALYRRPGIRSRTETVFVATQHGAMLLNRLNIETEIASPSTRPLCLARTG